MFNKASDQFNQTQSFNQLHNNYFRLSNLTIKKTKDVIISLLNQSTLTIIDVLFVFDLIVNLINTSRLWYKRIIVNFSSMKSISLRYNSQLVAHVDNVND